MNNLRARGVVCCAAYLVFACSAANVRAQAGRARDDSPPSRSESTVLQKPEVPASQNEPDQRAPAVVLRQIVRRVVIDVVVTDSRNRLVSGLQPGDFQVFEDGQQQTVRHFDFYSSSQPHSSLVRPANLPAHTYMNLPEAPENGPVTVILYDLLNTPLDAQLDAHRQIVNFLKAGHSGSQTAIFVLSDRLHLLQGFTASQAALLRAVESNRAQSQRSTTLENPDDVHQGSESLSNGGQGPGEAAGPGKPISGSNAASETAAGPSSALDMLARAEALEAGALLDLRVESTIEALDEIARFLSGVPGRKNLIWLSGSFPVNVAPDPDAAFGGYDLVRAYGERMRETADMLNASQVAVYPVDVRGLRVNPMYQGSQNRNFAPGSRGGRPPADVKAIQDFNQQQASEHGTMDAIGQRTGGRAFYNTNGLVEAMQAATDEGSNYYSLEYEPANTKYDGSLRRIRIVPHREGLHLAYRRSYFADDVDAGRDAPFDPTQPSPQFGSLLAAMQFGAPQVRQLIFAAHVDAIGTPAPATQQQMEAFMPYLQLASRVKHQKFVVPQKATDLERYAVQYAVLASQLNLPQDAGNVYKPDLTFAMLAYDEDGILLTGFETTIQDVIPESRIAEVRRDGYRTIQAMYVPGDAAVLRIAVRDGRTGRIGSMEVRLPLPIAPEMRKVDLPR